MSMIVEILNQKSKFTREPFTLSFSVPYPLLDLGTRVQDSHNDWE